MIKWNLLPDIGQVYKFNQLLLLLSIIYLDSIQGGGPHCSTLNNLVGDMVFVWPWYHGSGLIYQPNSGLDGINKINKMIMILKND